VASEVAFDRIEGLSELIKAMRGAPERLDKQIRAGFREVAKGVREEARELDAGDELLARLHASLDAEHQHRPEHALAEVLLRELVRRVLFEARVPDPRDLGMRGEPARQLERVLVVTVDAERESLQPLEKEERVERRLARSEIAQALEHADAIGRHPRDALLLRLEVHLLQGVVGDLKKVAQRTGFSGHGRTFHFPSPWVVKTYEPGN